MLVELFEGVGGGGCGGGVGVFEFSGDVVFGVQVFSGGGDLAGHALGFTDDIREHSRFGGLKGSINLQFEYFLRC